MSSIKNMEMWKDICNDERIDIKSSMLGLRTQAEYVPTHSKMKASAIEYSPQAGEKLKHIMEVPEEELDQEIGDFHPQPTVNGNYILEKLSSEDGLFTILLLLQYQNSFNYEPVTDVQVYKDEDAKTINRMF